MVICVICFCISLVIFYHTERKPVGLSFSFLLYYMAHLLFWLYMIIISVWIISSSTVQSQSLIMLTPGKYDHCCIHTWTTHNYPMTDYFFIWVVITIAALTDLFIRMTQPHIIFSVKNYNHCIVHIPTLYNDPTTCYF